MDVKEFLLTEKGIKLSEIARKMWPDNTAADIYLNMKLSGKRPFTKKDEKLALNALKDLSIRISKIQKLK